MKPTFAFALLLSLATTTLAQGPYRTWKLRDGSTLSAKFLSTQGDTILLRRMDGSTNAAPWASLSKHDQTHAPKPAPVYAWAVHASKPPPHDKQQRQEYKDGLDKAYRDGVMLRQVKAQYGEDSDQFRDAIRHVNSTGPGIFD